MSKIDTPMADAAHRLRRLPPRGATHVIVGPALVYGDDDTLMFVLVRGIPRGEHRKVGVDLGHCVPDPLDDPFAALFDTVLHVRRPGDVTMREGRERRAELIAELERSGLHVEDCATEQELLDAYARLFPGKRASKLRAAFEAEMAAA